MVDATMQAPAREIAARERKFYTRMALFLAALIVLGFGPSFYLKPLGVPSYPRPNPVLLPNLMVHGLLFSAWVATFVAQASLVAAGRRDLHRRLGAFGFGLGVAMVPVMYLTAVWQVARASQPPFTDPLTWTAVPLLVIPFYVPLLWLGWRETRRDLQAHKRIMLSLMIMLTEPAVSRLPLAPPTLGGFVSLNVLGWLAFVPLFVWDKRTRGSLHWATIAGATAYAAIIVLEAIFLATPGVWSAFAAHLPGIG